MAEPVALAGDGDHLGVVQEAVEDRGRRRYVAAVPGIAFGSDENVRLSFASSMEQINKGLNQIAAALG